MTASLSSKSSRALAEGLELYFLERGYLVHEFMLVQQGSPRPQKNGWRLVGELKDENEMHDFIEYCEGKETGRIKWSHVLYSWANWKRYKRSPGAHKPRGSHRRRR